MMMKQILVAVLFAAVSVSGTDIETSTNRRIQHGAAKTMADPIEPIVAGAVKLAEKVKLAAVDATSINAAAANSDPLAKCIANAAAKCKTSHGG